jgi:hypothetical protein
MRTKEFRVVELFQVQSGDFHAVADLDAGDVPLISCGDFNNGLVDYYDIPPDRQYRNAVTVAYNGSWPLTTKFHPYAFGAKDDVAVLVPRNPMKQSVLMYVAALLNRIIWRYSYGRKCFREKLEGVILDMPVDAHGQVDATVPDQLFDAAYARLSEGAQGAVKAIFAEPAAVAVTTDGARKDGPTKRYKRGRDRVAVG